MQLVLSDCPCPVTTAFLMIVLVVIAGDVVLSTRYSGMAARSRLFEQVKNLLFAFFLSLVSKV